MSGVRMADMPDVKAILKMAHELLSDSAYKGIKMDERKFKLCCAGLIATKNGQVFVIVDDNDEPQGFLMGVIDELFFRSSKIRY